MGRSSKKVVVYLLSLILFFLFGVQNGSSQPGTKEEGPPRVKLENVTFRVREIESTPSPLRVLEVHVEILNRSQRLIAPPNSIRAVVIPKEVKPSGEKSSDEFAPPPGEVTLNLPLPPRTKQTLIIGFSLPKQELESITFEVQLNPPEGETKVVTWEGK
jgi:hypothetical protein